MIRRIETLADEVRASGQKRNVVVAAADDADTLMTARDAWARGIADMTLVGPTEGIQRLAKEAGVDLAPFRIVDAQGDEACIRESIRLVREGTCEIVMKGRVRTADLMSEILRRSNGLRTERIVSHIGAFTAPGEDRVMIITDAGINIAPDLSRKRDIILNAVDVMHALGIVCPKVAVLSFIERSDSTQIIHPGIKQATEDAENLTELCKQGQIPGCVVEGPLALDNAISPYAAARKNIQSEVSGCADILVAHDINMGNAIYKALQCWSKVVFASVVVGSRTPVVVPSRADSKASKLQSIALTVLLMGRGAAK
jgi:phosphate butyryltransferase